MADKSKMPTKVNLGKLNNSTLLFVMNQQSEFPDSKRLMGFTIPRWQRPLCWSQEQDIRFMESAWLGLPLGTFTYNVSHSDDSLDNLLVDGQQRMNAIRGYLSNEFPVFGFHWAELDIVERRLFKTGVHFPSYMLSTKSEHELIELYNLLNFSGVAHTEDQRATV